MSISIYIISNKNIQQPVIITQLKSYWSLLIRIQNNTRNQTRNETVTVSIKVIVSRNSCYWFN